MYWPIGAPRIYAARKRLSSEVNESSTDDGLSSLSGNEGTRALQEVQVPEGGTPDANDSTKTSQLLRDYERKPSKTGVENADAAVDSAQSDDSILCLRMSRSGHMFGTITASSITVWQTRPTAILAVVVRSPHSLKTYGTNVSLLLRPDSAILVVQTSLGYLITYTLAAHPSHRVYKAQFVNTTAGHARRQSMSSAWTQLGDERVLWGPGEGGGVRSVIVRFRMVIKIDAGIRKALALDDELVVATQRPEAVQCIRWTPDSTDNQTHTELLSRMDWITKKSNICEMVHDRAMQLSAWITNDGKAYAVRRQATTPRPSATSRALFRGYCFHAPANPEDFAVKTAINARFSMLATGCTNATIHVYNARDYVGNIPLSHKLKLDISPSSSGAITQLSYSADGYCLFAGFEKGWATWSVFGKALASSFGSDSSVARSHEESWLTGVSDLAWLPGGSDVLLVAPGDERIWILEMARSAITTCFAAPNLSRSLLQTSAGFMLYRGFDSSDFDMVSTESALWHIVQIPPSYLVDQWPIRCVVTSTDGRYVAVAGRRGLAHYSVTSGRWKNFVSENMENEFVVRGGMCWHRHILIAAVEQGDQFEIRLYSRELALDSTMVLHTESLFAPAVMISLSGVDSLLVYTYDNALSHYVINMTPEGVSLVQVGQIGFHGIVRSPARVRAMSWLLPDEQIQDGDPTQDVAVASVLFLVDGKLVLLQPSTNTEGELKYDMRVMMQNVEFFSLTRDQPLPSPDMSSLQLEAPMHEFASPGLGDSLWVFDGTQMKVWADVQDFLRSTSTEAGCELPAPAIVTVDFYPLSVSLDKAVLLGVESDLIQRRDSTFAFFKLATRTHLFLPYILQHYLGQNDSPAALHLCHRYQPLQYFAHALEILLHDVLDDAVDGQNQEKIILLPRVTSFLSSFPEFLDIVVQCTRKTEVRSWKTLFEYLPPPQELFEESLQKGLLKTAGGYLLILQTFDELGSNSGHVVQLLSKAKAAQDWELCKELARFLMALDESGSTLREALDVVHLKPSSGWQAKPAELDRTNGVPPLVKKIRLPTRPNASENGNSSLLSSPDDSRANTLVDTSAQDYFSSAG